MPVIVLHFNKKQKEKKEQVMIQGIEFSFCLLHFFGISYVVVNVPVAQRIKRKFQSLKMCIGQSF